MKVLVACEFSGRVRDAFINRGHDAVSCDLLPTESPGPHIQQDVLELLDDDWDLMIAHPPCTYLCNSGVRWLCNSDGSQNCDRWKKFHAAGDFFSLLLDCYVPKICVENPIPHRYAVHRIGRKYDQIIQPWQFGCGEQKSTCLWLKNLPKLQPTNIVEGRFNRLHRLSATQGPGSSKDRKKNRSITYQGIADAMAEQWG